MSEKVRNMFANIAGKYDFMNNLLSFGIHHRWRKKAVKISGIDKGGNVLDCATGTGDLAIDFMRKVGEGGSVTGLDFCREMIEIAGPKAGEKGLDIDFIVGDVMALPFDDDTYDVASISFGIRNVDSPLQGLTEMARVVKPGGKVIVLEFGQPEGFFAAIYKAYSKIFIPVLGKLFAKNLAAYMYLPETASRFPCREDFINIMNKTGKLENCFYKPVTFGIAYIYSGTVKSN